MTFLQSGADSVRPGQQSGRVKIAAGYAGLFLLLTALALAYDLRFDVFTSGFSGNDESAHFVNAYFFRDFLAQASLRNPMAAATEFYISYPKLSIGHWPPLYYLAVAFVFLLLPATPAVAMAINSVVVVLPALLAAALIHAVRGWRWAVLAGLACLLTPLTLSQLDFFLLDQPVAFLSLLAAACWHLYARRPGYLLGVAYGVIAAAAILTKGNGWLLGLFPVFHILLTRRWQLLAQLSTWLSAAVALAAVVPWYLLTASISADGFNFSFGIDYALQALQFNAAVLARNLGPVGILLAALALAAAARRDALAPPERELVATAASLILATLALQSLVPVALSERYMAPAIPGAVILAVLGLARLRRLDAVAARPLLRQGLTVAAAAGLLLPAVPHLLTHAPQADMRMDRAAEAALAVSSPIAVVIDSDSGGEGAFIAEAAVRAPVGAAYVVRSSKLLSDSDFMGASYRLRIEDAAAAGRAIEALGTAVVVLERRLGGDYRAHNDLLLEYLTSPDSAYTEQPALRHRHRDGVTRIFVAKKPVSPDVAAIRKAGFPDKAPLTDAESTAGQPGGR